MAKGFVDAPERAAADTLQQRIIGVERVIVKVRPHPSSRRC